MPNSLFREVLVDAQRKVVSWVVRARPLGGTRERGGLAVADGDVAGHAVLQPGHVQAVRVGVVALAEIGKVFLFFTAVLHLVERGIYL